jgi:hypothetical protein
LPWGYLCYARVILDIGNFSLCLYDVYHKWGDGENPKPLGAKDRNPIKTRLLR